MEEVGLGHFTSFECLQPQGQLLELCPDMSKPSFGINRQSGLVQPTGLLNRGSEALVVAPDPVVAGSQFHGPASQLHDFVSGVYLLGTMFSSLKTVATVPYTLCAAELVQSFLGPAVPGVGDNAVRLGQGGWAQELAVHHHGSTSPRRTASTWYSS